MVQPATVSAVAGALLCTNAANSAGIAFDSFARRGNPIRLGQKRHSWSRTHDGGFAI
jgi:hypothetical protein